MLLSVAFSRSSVRVRQRPVPNTCQSHSNHSKGSLPQNCRAAEHLRRDDGSDVLSFFACNEVICRRSEQSTHDGSNPEEPELADSPTTDEQRDACASRRIDRSIRHWNADEVN